MKYVRWGLIGIGETAIGEDDLTFNTVAGSKVVAIMHSQKQKAKELAKRYNIESYTDDVLELIENTEVNAIYIATQPETHATYAVMAMNAGKPVLIEQPVAASYDDCIRINNISSKLSVPCFVAYPMRFMPRFRKVKQLILDDAIGKILNIQSTLYTTADSTTPENQYEHKFYKYVPQQLDILQEIFGIIVEANGLTSHSKNKQISNTINSCLMFEGNVPAVSTWCFNAADDTQKDVVEVIGERGIIRFSVFTGQNIIIIRGKEQQNINVEKPVSKHEQLIKSVVEDIQGFNICTATSVSATPSSWVVDRILKHH